MMLIAGIDGQFTYDFLADRWFLNLQLKEYK